MGFLTMLRSAFRPNLEILTLIISEWSRGPAQNGIKFDFQVQFAPPPPQKKKKKKSMLTKVFLRLWSNFSESRFNMLQIIAWTNLWLTHGQADTQTEESNDSTRKPKLTSGEQ